MEGQTSVDTVEGINSVTCGSKELPQANNVHASILLSVGIFHQNNL